CIVSLIVYVVFCEPEVRVGICAFHWVSECRWGQWHGECRLSLAWCADTRGVGYAPSAIYVYISEKRKRKRRRRRRRRRTTRTRRRIKRQGGVERERGLTMKDCGLESAR
ncbi:hypothetical protein M0804_002162, partial [Polistes exclamans]